MSLFLFKELPASQCCQVLACKFHSASIFIFELASCLSGMMRGGGDGLGVAAACRKQGWVGGGQGQPAPLSWQRLAASCLECSWSPLIVSGNQSECK